MPTSSLIKMFSAIRVRRIFGTPGASRIEKRESGNHSGRGLADSGEQADDGIEPEAKISSWDSQKIIHDQRDPFEKRIERRAFLLFLGREDFPLDFACWRRFQRKIDNSGGVRSD